MPCGPSLLLLQWQLRHALPASLQMLGCCNGLFTQSPYAAVASPSWVDVAQLLLQPAAALLSLPHLQASPQQ
jgi:hypothetical protein